MTNSNGFTFIETMISLLILSIVVAAILPHLITVQKERQSIRIERYVEEKLNNYYEQVFIHDEVINESFINNSILFVAETSFQENLKTFCIFWSGENGRDSKRCLSAFK